VEQRIALEQRLQVLPQRRRAMREGRISYEKARLIAWQADDTTVDEFTGVAEAMTCIELRRKLEGDEESQMCARSARRAAATTPRTSSACAPRITCTGCTRGGSGSAAWRRMLWNGSLARSVLPQQQSPEGDGQRPHERQKREQQRGRVAEVERVSKARSLRDEQRRVVPIDVEHSCPPGGWI